MGGRGANIKIAAKGSSLQNDEILLNQLKNKMAELAPYAVVGRTENKKKRIEYYKVQKQFSDLRRKIDDAKLNPVMKPKETQSSKTFVNSYGEATTRNITNSTYERGQKSLQKQISNFVK